MSITRILVHLDVPSHIHVIRRAAIDLAVNVHGVNVPAKYPQLN